MLERGRRPAPPATIARPGCRRCACRRWPDASARGPGAISARRASAAFCAATTLALASRSVARAASISLLATAAGSSCLTDFEPREVASRPLGRRGIRGNIRLCLDEIGLSGGDLGLACPDIGRGLRALRLKRRRRDAENCIPGRNPLAIDHRDRAYRPRYRRGEIEIVADDIAREVVALGRAAEQAPGD